MGDAGDESVLDDGLLAALFLLFFDEAPEKKAPVPPATPRADAQERLDFPSLRFEGESEPPRPPAPPGDA